MDQDDKAKDEVSRLPLRTLGLKPGMAMQTRRLAEGASKKEAQYFGAIEGKGVMVGPFGADSERTELEVGEVCVVRGFTGQYEYSFLSKVLQTFEKPFAYALLAYPAAVDAKLVRHSMRVKRSWPVRVSTAAPAGAAQSSDAGLVDISSNGAMIRAPSNLAPVGAALYLKLSVELDQQTLELQLQAAVCHNNRASYEDAFFIGVVFKGLTPQDKLVLSYLTQGMPS